MMKDKDGLLLTAYMLLAIALEGNEDDMIQASQAVSGFALKPDLAQKYMEHAIRLMETPIAGLN